MSEAFGMDLAEVQDKCDAVEAKIEMITDELEYRTGEADDHAECDGSVPIDFNPFELPPEVPEMSMVMLPDRHNSMSLFDELEMKMSRQLCVLAKLFEVCDAEEVEICTTVDGLEEEKIRIQDAIDACIPPLCGLEAHFAMEDMMMMDGEGMMGDMMMMAAQIKQDGEGTDMAAGEEEAGDELPEGCDPDAYMVEFMESDAPKTSPAGIALPDDRMVETD
jgi:hypothetical protein